MEKCKFGWLIVADRYRQVLREPADIECRRSGLGHLVMTFNYHKYS